MKVASFPLCVPFALLFAFVLQGGVAAAGSRRIIVDVPAVEIAGRPHDEMPAEVRISGEGRAIDLATIRVVRWDSAAQRPTSAPLPFRWYDDAIPYEFPECEQNVHATDGVNLSFVTRPRWGDFFNVLGEGAGGRLVWPHRQAGQEAAEYEVTFDLLPEGSLPSAMPPRGWVGDGSHRCLATGSSTTGAIHSRIDLVDWNGDGLLDLLVGSATGHVLFYPNRGDRERPEFPWGSYVNANDGRPIDVGWSAAPRAIDWDADGDLDLLSGCERNRVLLFRNEGRDKAGLPRLALVGFVRAGNEPIVLPVEPVPNSQPGVFTLDYYPLLDVVDWTGDGQPDLLAGGYITGRVFLYEATGRDADGLPLLKFAGPLEADGLPLNVGDWAAAPCATDFDSDGDLDLVSGNMAITATGADASDAQHFLRYYENTGRAGAPQLVERPFPKQGEFPASILGTPRAGDFTGDGLVDLVVSAGESIFLYANVGARESPRFQVPTASLASQWGSAPLPTFGVQFFDANDDGALDLLSGLNVYRSRGEAFEVLPLLSADNVIEHVSPRGDPWTFTQLGDLDGDGVRDLLWGVHEGHVYWHRGAGAPGQPIRYGDPGVRLALVDGSPIQVGPIAGQAFDFDVLQGARTTLASLDADQDGREDLVVGDTYGKVRYYRQATGGEPRFEPPVELGDMKIRTTPFAVDWNGDGRIDVAASAASGGIEWYENLGDRSRGNGGFAEPKRIEAPAVPYGPFATAADWNNDGDIDLIIGTAYGYSCYVERSFLDRGYARGTVRGDR